MRNGKPDEKKEVLASIPAEQLDDVVIAMPQQMRNQLMAVAPESLRRKFMLSNAPQQVIAYDLSEGKLYRAILSNRQLQEQTGRLLVQPFQRVPGQGQRPLHGAQL